MKVILGDNYQLAGSLYEGADPALQAPAALALVGNRDRSSCPRLAFYNIGIIILQSVSVSYIYLQSPHHLTSLSTVKY